MSLTSEVNSLASPSKPLGLLQRESMRVRPTKRGSSLDISRLNAEELRRKVTDADIPADELRRWSGASRLVIRQA